MPIDPCPKCGALHSLDPCEGQRCSTCGHEWFIEITNGIGLVRLYSLTGPFKVVWREFVQTETEARAIVESHLRGSGFTKLRTKDDEDGSLRFIADPPVGRKGRNVAAMDL